MGNAYRKLIDGGNAVTSYNKALEATPTFAAAKNGIGKIYETQKNQE
jgi:cytochrome c-type biogenesis protein CcmH/NrfG